MEIPVGVMEICWVRFGLADTHCKCMQYVPVPCQFHATMYMTGECLHVNHFWVCVT